MDSIYLTNRMSRILNHAQHISKGNVLSPHHIFTGACHEATGVCGDLHLYLHREFGHDYLSASNLDVTNDEPYFHYRGFVLSEATYHVFVRADQIRKNYNQEFTNEGHVIQSMLEFGVILHPSLNQTHIDAIITIACSPRDLFVPLTDWSQRQPAQFIRRATHHDIEKLKNSLHMNLVSAGSLI